MHLAGVHVAAFALGLSQGGSIAAFPSQSVIKQPYQSKSYALTKGAEFDVVIAFDGGKVQDQHWKCLCPFLRYGDIWVTCHQPFLPERHTRRNDFVFKLLRGVGIRIVAQPKRVACQ
jgi:hypothetical protein